MLTVALTPRQYHGLGSAPQGSKCVDTVSEPPARNPAFLSRMVRMAPYFNICIDNPLRNQRY